uniref:AP2/ERF domain-containing protein n=1 Tax=Solanum lycopersicum TaxID=4081 RepID=A0A3Q7EBH1_SOLLC
MNKRHWLGSFATADAAALAYDKASIEIKRSNLHRRKATPSTIKEDKRHATPYMFSYFIGSSFHWFMLSNLFL